MKNKLQGADQKALTTRGWRKAVPKPTVWSGSKNEAAKIVAEARAQAEEIVKKARDKAEDVEKNTMTEIALAGKQGRCEDQVGDRFDDRGQGHCGRGGVKEAALDPAFIKEMLLAVARNWNGADAASRS